MADSALIEKVRTQIRERRFTTLLSPPRPGVYLFFSFDLVNSTQFKASHPTEWVVVVTRFYELIIAELTTRLGSVLIWKFVGDEVLFFKRVTVRKDLHSCLPAAHDALLATVEVLHKTFPQSRELLDIKGTVWIAEAEPVHPSNAGDKANPAKNVIVETGRYPDNLSRDFLGPDIDTGFRISKFALRQRLVVSAELACLLYRERTNLPGIEDQLKLVTFEMLKGVWGGRHYPIVWFERDWSKVPESFLYDEPFLSPLAKRVKDGLPSDAILKRVEKVFADLGRAHQVDVLADLLERAYSQSDSDTVEIEIPKDRYAEIHCVAVCFDPNGRALVGRRPETKRRFPGSLEFGCGQLRLGESFCDCLKRAYRDDFGADLLLPSNPVPVGTFEIQDAAERRVIPGIIFVAEVQNSEEVEKHFSHEKHSQLLWIRQGEFDASAESCVPDFPVTLESAFRAWKASKSG